MSTACPIICVYRKSKIIFNSDLIANKTFKPTKGKELTQYGFRASYEQYTYIMWILKVYSQC